MEAEKRDLPAVTSYVVIYNIISSRGVLVILHNIFCYFPDIWLNILLCYTKVAVIWMSVK